MTSPENGGYPALILKGQAVIAPKAITATDFNTIAELQILAKKQGLTMVIVTKYAWIKYERMLYDKKDLEKVQSNG